MFVTAHPHSNISNIQWGITAKFSSHKYVSPLWLHCLRRSCWLHCSCLCRRPGLVPAHNSLAANCSSTDATDAWYIRQCSNWRSLFSIRNSHINSFWSLGKKCQSIQRVQPAAAPWEMSQHSPPPPKKKKHCSSSSLSSSTLLVQTITSEVWGSLF